MFLSPSVLRGRRRAARTRHMATLLSQVDRQRDLVAQGLTFDTATCEQARGVMTQRHLWFYFTLFTSALAVVFFLY